MEELQIALCEDDKKELERLTHLLLNGPAPVKATAFDSGEAFLKEYQPGRFDMVLMDIYMDGISGVETVRRLREQDPDLPVAFVTSSQEHALDGYRLKVAKYLEKPVSQADMDDAVTLAAGRRVPAAVEVVLQGEKNAVARQPPDLRRAEGPLPAAALCRRQNRSDKGTA